MEIKYGGVKEKFLAKTEHMCYPKKEQMFVLQK